MSFSILYPSAPLERSPIKKIENLYIPLIISPDLPYNMK